MSFDFNDLNANAGGDGIPGPFINWQSRRGDHAAAQTWTIRIKHNEDETEVRDITDFFKAGVIFDYNTIKLGWEKWAPIGERNEVSWAPTPNLQAYPRPSMDKRTNGLGNNVFVWQKVFAIRIAVSADLAGSWCQSQVGSMTAFEGFIEQLKVAGPQHPGKLPLVKFEGVLPGYGDSVSPNLKIADWKDAPACLKQEIAAASTVNAGPATAPTQPAAATTPPPQPETAGGALPGNF
ncbi:MAG: hypothetical protein ACPG6L_10655 [Nereida ignava]